MDLLAYLSKNAVVNMVAAAAEGVPVYGNGSIYEPSVRSAIAGVPISMLSTLMPNVSYSSDNGYGVSLKMEVGLQSIYFPFLERTQQPIGNDLWIIVDGIAKADFHKYQLADGKLVDPATHGYALPVGASEIKVTKGQVKARVAIPAEKAINLLTAEEQALYHQYVAQVNASVSAPATPVAPITPVAPTSII